VEILEKILTVRAGGHVRRYHVETITGEQNVATHSFHMACLALELWPDASRELLQAILWHDVTERAVGDVPAPAKRANPELWSALHVAEARETQRLGLTVMLTEEDQARFVIVDALEACFFGVDQIRLGNQVGWTILRNGVSYVYTHNPSPLLRLLLEDLMTYAKTGVIREQPELSRAVGAAGQ
jgi:5'-deoxynucleotidase YfbR-like HD superfamily hydrolase